MSRAVISYVLLRHFLSGLAEQVQALEPLKTTVSTPLEPLKTTVSIPLGKQHVPVIIGGKEVAKKTAYFGKIFVGLKNPQEFTVVFDTGSAHVILPASTCKSEPCARHKRYQLSESAEEINYDGSRAEPNEERDEVAIAYGTGEVVGDFVNEAVCLSQITGDFDVLHLPESCAKTRVITAQEMSAEPFSHFEFDGVLGLGLSSLALEPEFHFFSQMTKDARMAPVFSVFLSKSEEVASEITFGGHRTERLAGLLQWVPVASPEQGYWRVPIRSIRVGDEPIPFCDDGTCTAIVDTGTSMLGVPTGLMQTLLWSTAREVPTPFDSNCRNVAGPPLFFDVLDGFSVQLEAEDYSRPTPNAVPGENNVTHLVCRASLLPIEMPALGKKVFLWGEPVLQKYYTSYDSKWQRVGFALARQHMKNATMPMVAV